MKNSVDIDEKIQALKKNVANQCQGDRVCHGGGHHDGNLTAPRLEKDYGLKEDDAPTLSDHDCSGDPLVVKHVAKDLKRGLSVMGSQMVASIGVSYALACGVGHLFTLSSFSRIIIGALLAFAANGLTVYRMIKQ
jgi:hypothetical protein